MKYKITENLSKFGNNWEIFEKIEEIIRKSG